MSNIKNLFATPRKAVLSSLCILVILAGIGVGTVFAAGAFAESSAIGAENAQKFAFADAGRGSRRGAGYPHRVRL